MLGEPVVLSLCIVVEREADGSYSALAPWLTEPVRGPSWEAVYHECARLRRKLELAA